MKLLSNKTCLLPVFGNSQEEEILFIGIQMEDQV